MWDYVSMIFWVFIAVAGFVVYTNPSLWVRHMYEGFDTLQSATQSSQNKQPTAVQQTQQQQQQQQQQQPPINVNAMLRNFEQLINTPGNIPDVQPKMPSAAAEQPQHESNTGRQQPLEAEGKSSRPQPVNQPQVASKALEQGKAFQQTLPKADAAVKEIIKERIVEVPVPRTCPRQQACPVCPDMQQYIRKDSIPCWACKL